MRVTGALFLAGAGLALSTWAAVACTTADVRFSDFQFRRVSVTGVAITGEVINDCAERGACLGHYPAELPQQTRCGGHPSHLACRTAHDPAQVGLSGFLVL